MTTSHFPPERELVARRYEFAVRWFVERLAALGISSRPAMFQEALEEGLLRTSRVVSAAMQGARKKPDDVLWVQRGLYSEDPEVPGKVMIGLAAAYLRVYESS